MPFGGTGHKKVFSIPLSQPLLVSLGLNKKALSQRETGRQLPSRFDYKTTIPQLVGFVKRPGAAGET